MTCEELLCLLDEEGHADTPAARAHLEGCAACSREVERWSRTQAVLRELRHDPTPPFLHARVMAGVREATVKARRGRSWLHGWRVPALAALGTAVVVVGLGLYRGIRPPSLPAALPETGPAVGPTGKDSSHERRLELSPPPAPTAALPAARPDDEKAKGGRPKAGEARRDKSTSVQTVTDTLSARTQEVAATAAGTADAPAARPAPGPGAVAPPPRARELAGTPVETSANATLQVVAGEAEQTGWVRCRLRIEGEDAEVALDLPVAEAPPADEVWHVTIHPDGRLDLADAGGQHRQPPEHLQQGLSQQRAGRYRLSQAPLR